ncbi:MAG: hypothetical protein V4592_06770 [Bacteroidota bacterium]
MKKLYLFTLLCAIVFNAKAQYTFSVATGPGITPVFNYVFVGSLSRLSNDSGNSQKLQVDVLGSGWFSDTRGVSTFYIANRGGLSVSQITSGGLAFNGTVLKAYQNGDQTDFYLAVNSSTGYYTFAIKAYTVGFGISNGLVTITTQTATPSGTDVTASLNINPIMITDADGNIGLNTASPDPGYKLSVNGKIRAKEIKVETGWADYVFDSNYRLRPLKEVAAYIDQNHHLPDVPSTADVAKNGINIGETNALLLKKIEELTLYLIEKDKALKAEHQKVLHQGQQINRQEIRLKRLEQHYTQFNKH